MFSDFHLLRSIMLYAIIVIFEVLNPFGGSIFDRMKNNIITQRRSVRRERRKIIFHSLRSLREIKNYLTQKSLLSHTA